jgi:hypothetical protein
VLFVFTLIFSWFSFGFLIFDHVCIHVFLIFDHVCIHVFLIFDHVCIHVFLIFDHVCIHVFLIFDHVCIHVFLIFDHVCIHVFLIFDHVCIHVFLIFDHVCIHVFLIFDHVCIHVFLNWFTIISTSFFIFVTCFNWSVSNEGYSRNASCALNLISTFSLLSLGWRLCWWTISPRVYHQPSSQWFGIDLVY